MCQDRHFCRKGGQSLCLLDFDFDQKVGLRIDIFERPMVALVSINVPKLKRDFCPKDVVMSSRSMKEMRQSTQKLRGGGGEERRGM